MSIVRFLGALVAGAFVLASCTSADDGGFQAASEAGDSTTSLATMATLPVADAAARPRLELLVDVPDGGDDQGEPTTTSEPGDDAGDDGEAADGGDGTPEETSSTDAPPDTSAGATTTTGRLVSTTTVPATTTTRAPSTAAPTSASSGSRFVTLPPGSSLPSGAACAARVRSAPETRAGNAGPNNTRGVGANDRYPRVDGNFVGTTDEILQWAACKWGIDEDIVRAQATIESWWRQSDGGDRTNDQSKCHPDVRTSSGPCPESVGLLQVRYAHHAEAYENGNAVRSSAYNVDYAYGAWRACFEGELDWLNTVERGSQYGPGDVDGCLGVWFAGRWRTQPAMTYVNDLKQRLRNRTWEHPDFLGHG